MILVDDGGYALAGTTRSTEEGAYYDIWFAKVDASGEQIPEFPIWTLFLVTVIFLTAIVTFYRRKLGHSHLQLQLG